MTEVDPGVRKIPSARMGDYAMARSRIVPGLLVIWASAFQGSALRADEPASGKGTSPRHDRPPRKVIVGTTMTRWYSNYPGLDGRIEEMCSLVDQMATESRSRYGRSLDLALFTEYAVTAGKEGQAV